MLATVMQELILLGVPEYTIVVLLFLPIVATLVTFSRYVVGWKSLSIYATILLTFALYELARMPDGTISLVSGLIQGGVLTASVTFVAFLLQQLTRNIRLHYLSRVSIIVSLVTLLIFALLYFAALQNISFEQLNTIAILIIVLVADLFVRMYIRKGWRKALKLLVNTIGISYLIFVVIAQPTVKEYVLAHPEIVLFMIFGDVILGRWRKLRLTEYLRFKDISFKDKDNA